MRNVLIGIIAGLVIGYLAQLVWANPTPYASYIQSLESDDVITDEQAIILCDDLGLVYDYDASGYTVADFCYDPFETLSWEG